MEGVPVHAAPQGLAGALDETLKPVKRLAGCGFHVRDDGSSDPDMARAVSLDIHQHLRQRGECRVVPFYFQERAKQFALVWLEAGDKREKAFHGKYSFAASHL